MKKKLVIIEAAFSGSWGGLEMLAGQYAAWFAGRGHGVILCAPENERLRAAVAGTAVRIITVRPWLRYLDIRAAVAIARLIRRENADIIHAHISRDLSTLRLAVMMARRGRLVFTQHMDSRYNKRDLFHRWLYRGVDRIVTITDGMRENQLRHTPARPEQVVRVYNGIDTKRFAPRGAAATAGNLSGIPPGRKVIGLIARLDRLKDQMLLVRAAPKVIAKHRDAYFLIIGDETPGRDGEGYRRELADAVRNGGLDEYVSIMGFQENIEDYMAACRLLVLTTPKESFGLVLIEGMSMEKPVIGARAGGAAEIISDGVTGRLFAPGDAESLAGAIINILDSPVHAAAMGSEGRSDVLRRFDRETNFAKYEELFYELISNPAVLMRRGEG